MCHYVIATHALTTKIDFAPKADMEIIPLRYCQQNKWHVNDMKNERINSHRQDSKHNTQKNSQTQQQAGKKCEKNSKKIC